ncbi:unnamed protein product [Soboliphyme baturini]|uniref:Uncharacterized protein n=1 Tax=Soboliphyme baturini TaxID=241478 RepID=A0A183IBP1_9BILA|nr:unnamed protein product [Soboliphyme baturini]
MLASDASAVIFCFPEKNGFGLVSVLSSDGSSNHDRRWFFICSDDILRPVQKTVESLKNTQKGRLHYADDNVDVAALCRHFDSKLHFTAAEVAELSSTEEADAGVSAVMDDAIRRWISSANGCVISRTSNNVSFSSDTSALKTNEPSDSQWISYDRSLTSFLNELNHQVSAVTRQCLRKYCKQRKKHLERAGVKLRDSDVYAELFSPSPSQNRERLPVNSIICDA